MFHFILKFLLRPVFWVYYKKITLSGLENVPATGPAILACNHPNSFLDALLVGSYCPRKIHFLARSDVFRSPLAAWILGKMSIIPVYRLQEGLENLERNQDTFKRCYDILDQGEVVLIFSEGLCIQEMRLRTLKKGTARIALEYTKTGKSLAIIPVGNNYPGATQPREHYMLAFGKTFDAKEFTPLYNENSAKGITAFNRKLTELLSTVVIDIRDKAHEKEYELLADMLITAQGPDVQKLVPQINEVQMLGVEERTGITDALKKYRAVLAAERVRDWAVASAKKANGLYLLYSLFFGLFYLPHLLPVALAKNITRKTVKTKEFYDSVLLGAGMILHWLWFLILTIVAFIINPVAGFAVVIGFPLTGALAVFFYDAVFTQKQLTARKKLNESASLRQQILSRVPQKSKI